MTSLAVPEYGRVAIGPGGFTRAQANALLAAARVHPLCRGDGANILFERNGWLHACQMVGVLAAPGCSLEILPKVDPDAPAEADETVRGRLVEMLDVALDLQLGAGEAAAMARGAPSLLDILIRLFAERLLAQVRRGLPRAYLPCEDDLPRLRGRLDVRRQFTVYAVRPDRLACRFDLLSADTPLNRLMKACVLRVEQHARRDATRRLLAELRILLADVAAIAPAQLPRDIPIDRTNGGWRALLALARLLLGRQWQDTRLGRAAPDGVSLLFPMNDLFEAYVAALARRALQPHGIEVEAQGGGAFCLGRWREGEDSTGELFATRPDLILRRRGRIVAIVDTKWKAIGGNAADAKRGVAQADVYQMMAYAQLYGAERLMLLYPHGAGRGAAAGPVASHRIAVAGGARLDIATVDVSLSRPECAGSLQCLLLGMVPQLDWIASV